MKICDVFHRCSNFIVLLIYLHSIGMSCFIFNKSLYDSNIIYNDIVIFHADIDNYEFLPF